jgi:hypothetical protein
VFPQTSEDAELSPLDVASLLHSFANAKKRVILLDYDGALIPQNSVSWFLQSQFSSPRHGDVGYVLASVCRTRLLSLLG